MTDSRQTSVEESTRPHASLFPVYRAYRPVTSALTSPTVPRKSAYWTSEEDSDEGDNRENKGLRERKEGNSWEGGRERERLQAKIETLHAANLDLEAEIRFKAKAVERLTHKVEETREEKEQLLGEIQELEDTVGRLESEKSELQGQLLSAKAAQALSPAIEQSEALEAELEDTKKRLSEVISRHSDTERKRITQFTQLESEINRLSGLTSKLNHKSKQTEIELKAAKEQVSLLNTALEEWKSKAEELSGKLERVREENSWEKEEKLGKLIEEKGKLKEELEEALWELEKEREGREPGSLQEELGMLEEENEGFGEWKAGRNSSISTETVPNSAEMIGKVQAENEKLRVQTEVADNLVLSLQEELVRVQQEAISAKMAYAQAATDLGLLRHQLKSRLNG